MLEREAVRLCRILLDRDDVSPLLNLGSSTRRFRERAQPHIARELFEPLRRAGIVVVHSDIKAGEGIDVAGDILDPRVRRALKERNFRCVLLANLLEHVRDRQAVAEACEDIAGPGGLILATAPFSYPYHADPIDTGYRPSPGELAGLFARSTALLAEQLVGPTFAESLRERDAAVARELARTLLWSFLAFARPKTAAASLDRWRWYGRPWRVSIALVRVGRALTSAPTPPAAAAFRAAAGGGAGR